MSRGKTIPPIRVSDEEYKAIVENAQSCSMPTTSYLRALGLNTPIKSTLDKQLILELMRVNADQGRLGGLLKLWLSGTEKGTRGNTINIRKLLKELEDSQKEIKSYIRALHNDS